MSEIDSQINRLRKNDFAGMETMRTFALGIIDSLRAPAPAAPTSDILSVIDPWTRGAFTGWTGRRGFSKITLDEAEEHFSLCMKDMMDAAREHLKIFDEPAHRGSSEASQHHSGDLEPGSSEADLKCDRCGSLGDTYRLCAGCGAPVQQSAAMSEWHDIDTAPKDGTTILVWRPRESDDYPAHVGIDFWQQNAWWRSRRHQTPTHWMPLPTAPIARNDRGSEAR